MPMPRLRAAAGLASRDRLALPEESRPRSAGGAVEDLDQRRFAGAVLAEQRMDLARQDREVDAVIGPQGAENP